MALHDQSALADPRPEYVVSGFAFLADHLLPSHRVAMSALGFVGVAIAAHSGVELEGASRRVYVVAAIGALYLNVAVGVVQAFLKVSVLHGRGSQQTEAPFVVTQAAVLALLVGLTVVAVRRLPESIDAAIAQNVYRSVRLS